MIGKLTGVVAGCYGDIVLLDACCNNCAIGYEVIMKQTDIETLKIGTLATVFVKEIVKEDDDSLYGFLSFEDRCWFEELVKLSGLGPKTALAILSTYTCEAITEAIVLNNCDFFSSVSGIGNKIANRIPVEMKKQVDKISEKVLKSGFLCLEKNDIVLNANGDGSDAINSVDLNKKSLFINDEKTANNCSDGNMNKKKLCSTKNNNSKNAINDAINALTALGFTKQQVYEDVYKIVREKVNSSTEEIVKSFLVSKGNK